jgi:MSHA biogenesis protein MshJ
MKLPAGLEKIAARFDTLSIRERVLTASAALAALLMIWTIAVLDPIAGKHSALLAEQTGLEAQIAAVQSGIQPGAADPLTLALAEEKTLQASIDEINAELASKSAGLIAPERMVQVIQDVLNRQRGVRLVSLHNKPVTSLAATVRPAAEVPMTTGVASEADEEGAVPVEQTDETTATEPAITGPFVHPVEIVVEGTYLDVLAYLQALESLEWRFYWKVLELETKQYPTNRVRIELSTLSLDKEWIGV